jgi:hypothetical protein
MFFRRRLSRISQYPWGKEDTVSATPQKTHSSFDPILKFERVQQPLTGFILSEIKVIPLISPEIAFRKPVEDLLAFGRMRIQDQVWSF